MENILKFALEHGIIDMERIESEVKMQKRKEILEKHPYKIWEDKQGKWRTWVVDDTKPDGRRQIKRSTKQALEDEIIKLIKQSEDNPTIEEIFHECNNRRLALEKISPATHTRNEQFFRRHYSKFGKKRIKDVTIREYSDFLEEQLFEFHLSAKAFSGLKGISKMILKRAKKMELINWDIGEFFTELDVSKNDFYRTEKDESDEVFSNEELALIIPFLTEQRNDIKCMGLLLMLVTGMRVGELCSLKWSDYHDDYFLEVRRTETKYRDLDGHWHREVKEGTKTEAGRRTVIIPKDYKWVIKTIRALNPFGEYIFEMNRKRISSLGFWKRQKWMCSKLGIKQKSPHKSRKTYASILLDSQVSPKVIIRQLGHTDLTTTKSFYYRDRMDADEKLEILSAIPELQAK